MTFASRRREDFEGGIHFLPNKIKSFRQTRVAVKEHASGEGLRTETTQLSIEMGLGAIHPEPESTTPGGESRRERRALCRALSELWGPVRKDGDPEGKGRKGLLLGSEELPKVRACARS